MVSPDRTGAGETGWATVVVEDFENAGFGLKWFSDQASWDPNPRGENLTLHADSTTKHGGKFSARVDCSEGQRYRFQMVPLRTAFVLKGRSYQSRLSWRYSQELPGRVRAVGLYAKGNGQRIRIGLCEDHDVQRRLICSWQGKVEKGFKAVTLGPLTPEWKHYKAEVEEDLRYAVFHYIEIVGEKGSAGPVFLDDISVETVMPEEEPVYFTAEPYPLEMKPLTERSPKKVRLVLQNLTAETKEFNLACVVSSRWWNPKKYNTMKDRRQPPYENRAFPEKRTQFTLGPRQRKEEILSLEIPAGAWKAVFTASAGGKDLPPREVMFTVYPEKNLPSRRLSVRDRLEEGRSFYCLISDLSPMMLVRSRSRRLALFKGMGKVQGPQAGGKKKKGEPIGLPSWCAFVSGGNPIVKRMAEFGKGLPVQLSESWMLFWFRDSARWDKIGLWGKDAVERFERTRKSPTDPVLDIPVLVFFQRSPRKMLLLEDGIEFTFQDEAGYAAVMPFGGGFVTHPDVTGRWRRGLPPEVLGRCRWWNRIAKAYPIDASERFKVDFKRDSITFRTDVKYLSIRDDWGTPELRVAPLWPYLGMAVQEGLPARFARKPTDPGYPTSVGPWLAVEGESWEFSLDGFLPYVTRVPVYGGAPRTGAGRKALEMLRKANVIENTSRTEYWFAKPSKSVVDTGRALPYLSEEKRKKTRHALRTNLMYLLNPCHFYSEYSPRTRRMYNFDALSFPRYGRSWVDAPPSSAEYLRGIWRCARGLGDWDLVRANWPIVRGFFNTCDRTICWNYFDLNGGDSFDSSLNGCVAYARMAAQVGEDEEFRYGCYAATRYYICLYALVKGGVKWARKNDPYWLPQFGARIVGSEDGAIHQKGGDSCDRLGTGKWTKPVLRWQDIVISQADGLSLGFGPWNIPISMRGGESEFRFARDHCPDYGRYWFDGVVRRYAPEYYAAVTSTNKPAGPYLDRRNGRKVPTWHAGPFPLLARHIIWGEPAGTQIRYLDKGSPLAGKLGSIIDVIAADGGLSFKNISEGRRSSRASRVLATPGWETGIGRDSFVKKPDVCAYNSRDYAEFHFPGYGGVDFGIVTPRPDAPSEGHSFFGPAPREPQAVEMNWVLELFAAD